MWTITGNDVFDFYFGLPAFFAFLGWGAGMVRGLIRRVIR
jgi:hypothetical protein